MLKILTFLLFVLLPCCAFGVEAPGDSLLVTGLRCEYLKNPLGIASKTPEFSWELQVSDGSKNIVQTHYTITVSADPSFAAAGIVWDSGTVASSRQKASLPSDIKLVSATRYYWRVKAKCNAGRMSSSRDAAYFEMGLLLPTDWSSAQWIGNSSIAPINTPETDAWRDASAVIKNAGHGRENDKTQKERYNELKPALYLRKTATLHGNIARARAYICGLGYYKVYINGKRAGNGELNAPQVDYEARGLYEICDVTSQLTQGNNALGVVIGEGWFGQSLAYGDGSRYGDPQVKFKLCVEYADGAKEVIVSDKTWKASSGPILKNNIYAGEVYDARREHQIDGWNRPDFNDATWAPASASATPEISRYRSDLFTLEPQLMPPTREIETLSPVSVNKIENGRHVVAFAKNSTGVVRLKNINQPRGTALLMGFAENVGNQGRADYSSTGSDAPGCKQFDMYVCKGSKDESYQPSFTFHGFQYMEIQGCVNEPAADMFEFVVLSTDVETSGSFSCSNKMLNEIHKVSKNTVRSNVLGSPYDCPHRERCGWLGDAMNFPEMMLYNYDAHAYHRKFIRDLQTNTDINDKSNYTSPWDIAPGRRDAGRHFDWAVATVVIPYFHYLFTGDERALREHYPYIRKFLDREFADGFHEDGRYKSMWLRGDFLDQVKPGKEGKASSNTSPELMGIALMYGALGSAGQAATLSGDEANAKKYAAWGQNVKRHFNATFYNEKTKYYCSPMPDGQMSQTGCSFPVVLGLAPPQDVPAIAENIVHNVLDVWNGHLSTGIFGHKPLLQVLSETGHDDIAHIILQKESYPSFGHMINLGKGTWLEAFGRWTGLGKTNIEAASLSHAMQGAAVDAWLYQCVAGIAPDRQQPGFKNTVFRPSMTGILDFAKAQVHTPYGPASSSWSRSGTRFTWTIQVPVNTTATVCVPVAHKRQTSVTADPQAVFRGFENNSAVYTVGSGNWTFESQVSIADMQRYARGFSEDFESFSLEKAAAIPPASAWSTSKGGSYEIIKKGGNSSFAFLPNDTDQSLSRGFMLDVPSGESLVIEYNVAVTTISPKPAKSILEVLLRKNNRTHFAFEIMSEDGGAVLRGPAPGSTVMKLTKDQTYSMRLEIEKDTSLLRIYVDGSLMITAPRQPGQFWTSEAAATLSTIDTLMFAVPPGNGVVIDSVTVHGTDRGLKR